MWFSPFRRIGCRMGTWYAMELSITIFSISQKVNQKAFLVNTSWNFFLISFTISCHTRRSSQRHRRDSIQKDSHLPEMIGNIKFSNISRLCNEILRNLKNVNVIWNCVVTVAIIWVSPDKCNTFCHFPWKTSSPHEFGQKQCLTLNPDCPSSFSHFWGGG